VSDKNTFRLWGRKKKKETETKKKAFCITEGATGCARVIRHFYYLCQHIPRPEDPRSGRQRVHLGDVYARGVVGEAQIVPVAEIKWMWIEYVIEEQ
jgi:hypothetical protein